MGNLITNYSFSLHCSFQELIMDVDRFFTSQCLSVVFFERSSVYQRGLIYL